MAALPLTRRRRLLGGYHAGPLLTGTSASDYVLKLFRDSCEVPPDARAVRPFILLAAMPFGVFPFDERAARLARAMGMLKGEAQRALRRIDAVVDPAVFEWSRVSTTNPILLEWYAEDEQRFATDCAGRTRRPPLLLRGVRSSAVRR